MKDNTIRDEINYITCQTSMAHTFGNMISYIENWLESQFEPEHFKTKHIHSRIAHKQIRTTGSEFSKKPKPMLIIRPRIEWNDDSDVFLAGSLVTKRINDMYLGYGGSNLQHFIHDANKRVTMQYQMNREVFYFDIILIYGSLIQQVNMASYIKSKIRIDIPFFIETCLEGHLPKNLMNNLSKAVGIPLYDNNKSTKPFLDYINGKTMYPITYKLQNSSQTDEFYRYYPVNIDTLVTNFQVDEGEMNNRVNTKYSISFTIRCEFNTASSYFLFSDKFDKNYRLSLEEDQSCIYPVYTDVTNYEDSNLKDGWVLYNSPSCKLENRFDEVPIKSLLNSSIGRVIDYHIRKGLPLDPLIQIKVRQQGKPLESEKYRADYVANKLYFLNCPIGYTYKILVYINLSYANNLITELYGLNEK